MNDWEPVEIIETPQAERYPFWSYGDLLFLVGLALPCLVAAVILVRIATLLVPEDWNTPASAALAMQFILYGFWFACLWGLIRVRYGRPVGESLRWRWPRRGWLSYMLLGFVLALAIGFLGALTRAPNVEMPMRDLLSDRSSLLLVGVFAVTLGPVCEELIFRGFLLPVLHRSFGPVLAVILSAIPFSLLHGPQYGWSWQHIILITVAACMFGVIRVRSNSTAAAALMHAGYNLTLFVAYLSQWEDIPY